MSDPLAPVRSSDGNRSSQIVQEALIGMYASTPSGGLIFCNDAFVRLLGFSSVDEALGTPLEQLYKEARDRETFVDQVRKVRRVEPQRVQLRRRDGRTLDVLEAVVGAFDDQGNLVELRGQVVDITATVAMEATLRERELQFRAVFNDAADAILILDDARAIVDANPSGQRLFGISPREFGLKVLDDLVADRKAFLAVWDELLALGEVKREHRVNSAGGGRAIECSYRARVLAGRHLCVARDITERRMLEDRLQESQKIETVGRLAGGIAHDFNNLLTAMLGYTELLLGNDRLGERERADLLEIQKAGQRAASLTQQLLAFGRKQVLVPKEIDLNEALATVQSMLLRLIREDIRLVVQPAASPALVRIDPGQFEQVVANLVLNARDALPGGGTIQIGIEPRTVTAAEAAIDDRVPAGEYIRLHVADTGVGMSAEVRAHVFEPFFTTKDIGKGTGLGLASVHGIVTQSHGFVTVESEPGAGASFSVYLPAATDHRRADRSTERTDGIPGGATILLVEDEDAVRVIVSAVLRRNGYNVLEASTPRGACDVFAHRSSDIDLLLTDVIMPEMNGPALAQRLVADRPELKVLFISGYTDMAAPFASNNPNMAFLGKPFQASVLAERVRELLARPRAASAQHPSGSAQQERLTQERYSKGAPGAAGA